MSADPQPGFPATVGAGGVTVTTSGATLLAARDAVLEDAVTDGLAAALVAKDPTLWGPDAAAEASVRLGWLDVVRASRPLVPRLAALRERLRADGAERVVLAGMGGSSLAPEVIARTYGVELTVLDSTDPGQVRAALADLGRTALVVSSKSGTTVETDSARRAFAAAYADAGIDAARRVVVVTDPGSPLEAEGRGAGYEVVLADPDVGGRYSALTAFGLVPAALAGVDVGELLDQAAAVEPALGRAGGNPGLWLGAALGGAALSGRATVVLAPAGTTAVGLGDWAEQLLAESTGKSGRGLLPVVAEAADAPGTAAAADTHLLVLGPRVPELGTAVDGPLGAQFLVWELATAVAGRVLRVDPFDQPNVAESKANTTAVLDSGLPDLAPAAGFGPVEVHTDDAALVDGAAGLRDVLDRLLAALGGTGYLAVTAYLDRGADADAARLRPALAARTPRPVTFGWGPRFLHSTGQYHKGGPPVGVFLQVTGEPAADVAIPGRPYGFATLQLAQALGDAQALGRRGRPVLRLHLRERGAGLRALVQAAEAG